jgi:hypothetical protein
MPKSKTQQQPGIRRGKNQDKTLLYVRKTVHDVLVTQPGNGFLVKVVLGLDSNFFDDFIPAGEVLSEPVEARMEMVLSQVSIPQAWVRLWFTPYLVMYEGTLTDETYGTVKVDVERLDSAIDEDFSFKKLIQNPVPLIRGAAYYDVDATAVNQMSEARISFPIPGFKAIADRIWGEVGDSETAKFGIVLMIDGDGTFSFREESILFVNFTTKRRTLGRIPGS